MIDNRMYNWKNIVVPVYRFNPFSNINNERD